MIAPLIAAVLSLSTANAGGNSVELVNQSQFVIAGLFMSPVSQSTWGPDQLGQHVIMPGTSFTLTGIECGAYDVRLVGPNGESCTMPGVPMCMGAEQWLIDDAGLASCAP